MNVMLYGKNAQSLTRLVKSFAIDIVDRQPDLIISYGGDGTLLSAEREYPGLPKLALRDSAVCIKCAHHSDEVVLKLLAEGQLPITAVQKLTAQIAKTKVMALNDIVIRNSLPTHAVRFLIQVDNDQVAASLSPIIGDGIVAATNFGSTGYFKSITSTSFKKGFAIGFNNPTIPKSPIYFSSNQSAQIEIIRGPASLSYDNANDVLKLKEGDRIALVPANEYAKLYDAGTLRCQNCKIAREKRLSQF